MEDSQKYNIEWCQFIDTFSKDSSILEIVAACMNKFGDGNRNYSFSDWGRFVREYIEQKPQILDQTIENYECKQTESPIYNPKKIFLSINNYLREHPQSKAYEIASYLNLSKTVINSNLYQMQKKGVCKMDSSYRWSIITIETPTFAKESAIQYYSKQEAKSDIQPINANYETIEAFKKIFTNLKVSCRMGKKAPHKYILLISVFNLIGCGIIKSRRFGSSIEIEKEFMRNWNLYVPSDIPFNAIYTTPFWHMMSEPFWILYDKNGEYITNQWKNSITSIKKQRKEITAEITEELFELIQNNSTRELFISHLINCINLGLSE